MTNRRLVVIAVGGNSLITDWTHKSVPDQYSATVETCMHVATLIEKGIDIVLTHGNGPQVGFILRRSDLARSELHDVPLDSCVADTQGAIGYMFQRALHTEFRKRDIHKDVATVVTQVLVSLDDPAFASPSKPIGSFMDEATAKERVAKERWTVVQDAGRGFRRVVPSPNPLAIVELKSVHTLIREGFLVIAAGGGGIPVAYDKAGNLVGVEAVIDKDLAGALLATELKASTFLISTAVDRVAIGYGTDHMTWLDHMTASEARRYLAQGEFPAGSMGPKIEACLRFLDAGGSECIITSPQAIAKALSGHAGTRITVDE